MYIRFLIENNKIVYKGEAKPIVEEREFIDLNGKCAVAEYKGEIPKNDYLTVTNLREEIETWIEKKTIEKLDENGEPIFNENGEVVFEEITEEKSRTYLACDLLANFYPPKTEEELALEKEKQYSNMVEILIRKKYSQGKVESIHSNYLKAMFNGTDLTSAKKEEYIAEFNAFQEYRIACKQQARLKLGM